MVNSNLAYAADNKPAEKLVRETPLKWCSVPLSDVLSRGKRLEKSLYVQTLTEQ